MNQAITPTVYTATVQIAVAATSKAEAADAISAMLSENLVQSGALLDWQYATKPEGGYTEPTDTKTPAPKPFEFDEGSLFPDNIPMKTQTPHPAGHTPGPWTIDGGYPDSDTHPRHVLDADQRATCTAYGDTGDEADANAALIAAAPDLLAACEAMLSAYPDESWNEGAPYSEVRYKQEERAAARAKVHAAIRKARGQA